MENNSGRLPHFSSPSLWISKEISTTPTTDLDDFPERYHSWNDEEQVPREHLLNSCLVTRRQRDGQICPSLSTESQLIYFFSTDAILKFFTVIFYGILPCGFKNQTRKLHYSCLSLVFTLLQWNNFLSYIYFIVVYWTSEDYGPKISMTSALIILLMSASNTVTCTLVMHYFCRAKNNFSGESMENWSIIPSIQFDLAKTLGDDAEIEPKRQDWLLANVFLLLGLCSVVFLASADFALNMFCGFHGIHDFL